MRLHVLAAALVFCLAGCGAAPVRHLLVERTAGLVGDGTSPAAVMVEPGTGIRPLTRLIDHAQDRIFVEAYILTDSRIARALERAAAQGVSVYVLLEPRPYGMGLQPLHIVSQLRAAGVYVRWTRPDVALMHAKFLVLDDQVAVIGTANLSRAAFTRNREFIVVDRDRMDVRQVSNVFRADWNRIPAVLNDPDILASPSNARSVLTKLIGSARRSIDAYSEEIADRRVELAMIRAAGHGVAVRIVLPPDVDPLDVKRLKSAGVEVREPAAPYIHAKALIVDGRIAYVGSINLSSQSLDRNREVGVLIRGPTVETIVGVFDGDWHGSRTGRPGY